MEPLFEQDINAMSATLTLPFPSVYSKGKSIWAQKEMQPVHLKGKKTEQCGPGLTDKYGDRSVWVDSLRQCTQG